MSLSRKVRSEADYQRSYMLHQRVCPVSNMEAWEDFNPGNDHILGAS